MQQGQSNKVPSSNTPVKSGPVVLDLSALRQVAGGVTVAPSVSLDGSKVGWYAVCGPKGGWK